MAEHTEASHEFDRPYWEKHWQQAHRGEPATGTNPYLARETSGLTPGTALDAGCGEGGEARWLASRGWDVTAADISTEVLARAAGADVSKKVQWVQADLTVWAPVAPFDLVVTHYAHPSMSQLAFYDRVSRWVAPRGTLLIVGHLPAAGSTGHGHRSPAEASVTSAAITAGLDTGGWTIVTAEEHVRTLTAPDGRSVPLHDVVVRATRHG
ncbi:class I SAM-dependent methyltransferase [Amycolatopsis sp. H20-H5]|uniref:class I SAM-dependent methyltransferase n=1 Tax=Amycolatopsis sp. H20-H5 TaxID=3046309 RepID=UPI002DBC4CCD|nr:class I SAM-dependent methyltransferase [Amycolatopsis sp. H20-H5]MEC3974801.1 class I SAM-dependent methyltransferase [Amycolatopsis sp. H20-H5]